MKLRHQVIVLLGLVFLLSTGLYAQEDYSTISVSGQAKVSVDPDIIILSFNLESLDSILTDSKQHNDDFLQDVKDVVDVMNISAKDLNVSNFKIRPKYDKVNYEDFFKGYMVSRMIQLKLNDVSNYYPLIQALINIGISDVSYVEYVHTRKAELLVQARENALKKAKQKAQHMAAYYSMKLGKALKIEEISSRGNTYSSHSYSSFGNVMVTDDFSGEGAEGKFTVYAHVKVVFELLEK